MLYLIYILIYIFELLGLITHSNLSVYFCKFDLFFLGNLSLKKAGFL